MHWFNKRAFLKKVKEVGIDWKNVAVFHAHEITYPLFVSGVKRRSQDLKILLHFHSGPLVHLKTGRLGVLPLHSTLLYLFYRRNLELVDLPIFVSKRQQRLFGTWYAHGYLAETVDVRKGVWFGRFLRAFKLKPSIVLYNGIDTSVFNPVGRVSHADFRIGCVGNISENKDQMTLLRAARILRGKGEKDFSVILVGSGDKLDECRSFVTENGLEDVVEFRTEVDHLALPDFYRSLDLFVLPSWVEGFCCAAVEAAGCGTPIIGCRGVSIEEAIPEDDWPRWLITPKDADGLADLIYQFRLLRPRQRLTGSFAMDDLVRQLLASIQNVA